MKESPIKSALESIARHGVGEIGDLWPALSHRLGRSPIVAPRRPSLTWSLALALLALALLTTVAYALYRYFNDPGLRSAQEAGLFTDMNSTAESSPLTPQPPYARGSGMSKMVEASSTVGGVTVSLDWIYLEDMRQAFHITAHGLGPGMRLGVPEMEFPDTEVDAYTGDLFELRAADTGVSGTYLENRILRQAGQPPASTGVRITIPLLETQASDSARVGEFRFDLNDVEVTLPWGGGGGGAFAVSVNGIEMRLQHAIVAPSYVEVRLCFEPPDASKLWAVGEIRAQYANDAGLIGSSVPADSVFAAPASPGDACNDAVIPVAVPAEANRLLVSASGLRSEDGEAALDSVWQFSTDLLGQLRIGGVAAAVPTPSAPLGKETVGDLTGVLEWAYLDSNRMAFTVHFDGWRDGYSINYVTLRQLDGSEVNVGASFGPADSDPATDLITLTPAMPYAADRFVGQLVVDVNRRPDGTAPLQFAFDLDLPVYRAITVRSEQQVVVGALPMILQMVKVSPSWTVAYLCYKKPDSGDWGLSDETSLRIGEDQSTIGTYAMLYDSDYGDVGKGVEPGWKPSIDEGRCVKAGFPVGGKAASESMILTVPALRLSTPELIPEAALKRAIAQLKTEGIEMEWTTVSGTGGGGAGPVFKKLPAGMTEPDGYRRFLDALGYEHPGPWVFAIQRAP
jgi:hypothetical protein